jgi:hypothetical protein
MLKFKAIKTNYIKELFAISEEAIWKYILKYYYIKKKKK